jgi:hypothetical protein
MAEIDNALVVRIGHWKREVDPSSDALVRPGVAKRFAAEDIGAGSNLDANNARGERQSGQKQNQEKRRYTNTKLHARKDSTVSHISLPGRCTIPRTRRVQRIESRSVIRGG